MRLLPFLTSPAALVVLACSTFVEFPDKSFDDGHDDVIDAPDSLTDSTSDIVSDSSDTISDSSHDGPEAALLGIWGQLLNVTYLDYNTMAGQILSISRNWYLVELTSDGLGNITSHERLCASQSKIIPSTGISAYITMPQDYIDHVTTKERHVTVTSVTHGTPWISDIVTDVRGANLCDDELDPLPLSGSATSTYDTTSCAISCTGSHCDQDEDEHPGMTVTDDFVGCELYIAQRLRTRFDGEIIDSETIEGDVTDSTTELSVLAASSSACESTPEISTDDCQQHHYFKMIRLSDSATCADVLELTDCDEEKSSCVTNEPQPLDPNDDQRDDCS